MEDELFVINQDLRDRILAALAAYATTACGGGQEDLQELREELQNNLTSLPSRPIPPHKEAQKLAEALGYVGHGGWENKAVAVGDEVWCTCDHCPEKDHQKVKVHSINPIKVQFNNSRDITDFENVDMLREYIEELMLSY